MLFAWEIVFAGGEHRADFRALQLGPASRVAPVYKMSLALTVVLAGVLLREPITLRVAAGAALIVGGTLLMVRRGRWTTMVRRMALYYTCSCVLLHV